MKKLLFVLFLLPTFCWSQDILIDKDGNETKVKIIKVKRGKISYKKHDTIDESINTVAKRNYIKIGYEDGSEEVFDRHAIIDLEIAKQREEYKKKGSDYWKESVQLGDTIRVEILYQPLLTSKGEVSSIEEDGMTLRTYQGSLMRTINGKDYIDKVIKFENIKCIFDLSFYKTYK